ncbi:hypothetical protein [Flavobacterium sp.]|uniref:hypothetical protein n=1 Tax=Flavobacterium sp. TaxID=239 RepID=UPI0037502BA9
MKNYYKITSVLLMFIITTAFFSCEKDLYEEPIKNNKDIKIYRKTFKELKKDDTFIKAFNPLGEKLKSKALNRSEIEDNYNFKIDSTLIKEVVAGDYLSYTFKIDRDVSSENFYENLLIEIDSNNKKQISLIKYNFIPNTKEIMSIQSSVLYTEKTIYITECTPITVVVETACPCEGHWPNQMCDCQTQPKTVTYNALYCYQSSFNTPDGTGAINSNTGGGTWSGNPLYSDPNMLSNNPNINIHGNTNNVITVANELGPLEKRRRAFQEQLVDNNLVPCLVSLNNPTNDFENSVYEYLETSLITQDSLVVNPTTYPEEEVVFVNGAIQKACNNPDVFSTINPFVIEERIEDDDLDICSKEILNFIKNSVNNDVATIIAKLDSKPSLYTTKIINADLGTPAFNEGITNWTGAINGSNTYTPFDYTIKINSNLVNQGTKLEIYAVILHELIHAYFLSLIDDCVSSSSNCNPIKDLPYVWNQYISHINGNSPVVTTNISQHNQIATNYINVIEAALQEFQPGLPSQYYTDLAWGGLDGTIPYENDDPETRILTLEDKLRIDKILQAEALNTPQYNPSGVLTYFPQGFPCN